MDSDGKQLLLKQTINSVTGKAEWEPENLDEHDYFTDIARSSYADMLHDTERNKMYHDAIKLAVSEMHKRGKVAKVLDIGTGTGLLSMMAATAGAEIITAIEVFSPMAKVAEMVTKENGFEKIQIINKHSTEVKLGEDMKEKANILITELFDTELIGEGALNAYHHALHNLMEENCIAVPHKATTYVQIVESKKMLKWHQLFPIKIGKNIEIKPNPELICGGGVPAVHDIQLTQFPTDEFKVLSKPTSVFEFEWGSKALKNEPRSKMAEVIATASGTAQVVLSWWDLQMDQAGNIILSTAPIWCHPTPHNMQWRDHWIQSVYFLPNQMHYNKNDIIKLKAFHDEYSLWFNIDDCDVINKQCIRPLCDYPPRMLWSRPRLGMLNDEHRNNILVDALQSLDVRGNILCLSDFSLLPLFASQTWKESKTIALEKSAIAQRGLYELVNFNKIDNVEVIRYEVDDISKCLDNAKIALFAGEPFFASSYLPWHDLHFWYARSQLDANLSPGCKVFPCKAYLCIAAVEFTDLWKIRAPVGEVEGFNISTMDKMINEALEKKEYNEPEPHALWEYPNTMITKPVRVMCFDFEQCVPDKVISSIGKLSILPDSIAQVCHGVVLWMEYQLTPNTQHCITTGVLPVSLDGEFNVDHSAPKWNMHHRQAVFFLREPIKLSEAKTVKYNLEFKPESGNINMKYELQ